MWPRLLRPAGRVAGAVGAAAALHQGWDASCRMEKVRLEKLPADHATQRHRPAVDYPGWDWNWDYLHLSAKAVAKELGHKWPIEDYAAAVRKLFRDHIEVGPDSRYKSQDDVEKLICKRQNDLPELYRELFMAHAWGGAPRRIIILVRHGQYEEHRDLQKQLMNEVGHQQFELEERLQRDNYLRLDAKRVLTPLGREQAAATGDRLVELLRPALTTPGRENDVRIHVSTLTRAKETADIIASRLDRVEKGRVRRMTPDPNLSEGNPIIDMPGCHTADPAAVHVEGSRIEAAFRSLFYRGLPRKMSTPQRADGRSMRQRTEYDIVVCHGNVIRYSFLRALQLPPEAWLRFGGFNGSITVLSIRPNGRVGLIGFGDVGHLPLDHVTFGMHQGIE